MTKREDIQNRFSFESILIFASYTLLLIFIYLSAYTALVNKWGREDYSYCYLVPVIVLYLLWEKKTAFFFRQSIQDWKGLFPIVVGIAFYWLGELGGEFYIIFISSWLVLVGLCLLHFGVQKVKTIIFPLCFILAMFPLPYFLDNKITLQLKLVSSKIGVLMMHLYGMSAYREGNVIDLGFTQLQVVDACSGLRYLYPVIILSILVAYFFRARMWKKLVLVFSSIPLTIFSNSLRIALTGILSEKFGLKVIEGFFHDFEGWLIFMVTLGLLLIELYLLKIFFPERARKSDGHAKTPKNTMPEKQQDKLLKLSSPQYIVTIALLGLTLLSSQMIEFREAIPIAKPFDQFPLKISDWEGQRQYMEQKFLDELDLSDYYMADYNNDSGKSVNFYVAYYGSQRKGESIHSPATCLRGGGWNFKKAGKINISLTNSKNMSVNQALIEKNPSRQLSYYWFPMRGRVLTNAYEMKLFNFWDALTRQRTDGALVRLVTPLYGDESVESAEARLQAFMGDVVPVLNQFLPK